MRSLQKIAAFASFTLVIAGLPVSGERFAPWSEPMDLGPAVNSASGDFFAAISKDGRSLYFTSSRPHGPTAATDWDIYVSQRKHVRDAWGPAQSLGPAINTPFNEGAPGFSRDGRYMFFASNRPGGFGGNDIYVSRRVDKHDDFGWETPVNVGSAINTAANEASPTLFEDDDGYIVVLYFDSNREGGFGPFTNDPAANNGSDIYSSSFEAGSGFSPPVMIAELSTTSLDRQPVLRRDGLEIFLASNRPGSMTVPDGSQPSLDLWVSTRETIWDPWSTPVNVGAPINTAANEAGPALSFDARSLYFQSIRPATSRPFDLYVTTRSKSGSGGDLKHP